ncbi:MAG: NnrS family protein [Phycisphaeraceae bacterium]
MAVPSQAAASIPLAARPASAADPPPVDPPPVDTIYRRYFLAGIAVILTAGATWGAYLLWRICFAGSFTGISIHHVNAHGHAQIFGWVGLFMMGFAYQMFPRFWKTRLLAPRLAAATFLAMLVGLVMCTLAMPFPGQRWAPPTALAGGLITVAAAAVFAGQLVATFRRSTANLQPWSAFALAALMWFVIQAGFSTWHTWNLMTAGTQGELLWYLATYQAVLRDVQIHGLALFMILGVSMHMVPGLLRTRPTPRCAGWTALGALSLAVVAESVLFVAYRWTGNHWLATGLMLPWVMLAVGVALVAGPWRLWRRPRVSDRSIKFIRAAYLWLAISLVMLMLLPAHHLLSGLPFSHAYYGAIRHAITVGFISLMIMGMAAKIVPSLNGVGRRTLSGLWGPFILVNTGCLLRVSLQSLTDWHDTAFMLVGVSGVLEVAGLAWWSAHLLAIMWRGRHTAAMADERPDHAVTPARLASHHIVADVVHWHPQTIDVLVALGFTPVRSRLLRRTLARRVTLAQAAMIGRIPLADLLAALNQAIDAPPVEGLPSCSSGCAPCHCAAKRESASASGEPMGAHQ